MFANMSINALPASELLEAGVAVVSSEARRQQNENQNRTHTAVLP